MAEATQNNAQARPRDEQGRFVAYKTETLLNKNFDKFSTILTSVDRHMATMSSISQTILTNMSEDAERRKTQDQLDSVKRGNTSDSLDQLSQTLESLMEQIDHYGGFGGGSKGGGGGSSGGSDDPNHASQAFWGSILGSASAAFSKGNILKFGLAVAAAPFINRFVNDFITKSAENLGMSPDLAATFGESAGLASAAGMIGRTFGRRMGFISAAGAAAFGLGDEIADAMGLQPDQIIKAFGFEIQAQNLLGGVAAALSTAAATAISSPGVWKSAASAGVNALSFGAKMGGIGLLAAGGIYALYEAYGDDAKSILEEYGVGKRTAGFIVDGISYASMGAALGSKFGAPGIIAGALIGLSVGLAKGIFQWIKDRRAAWDEKVKQETEKYMDEQTQLAIDNPDQAGEIGAAALSRGSMMPTPEPMTQTEEEYRKQEAQDRDFSASVVAEAEAKKTKMTDSVEIGKVIQSLILSNDRIGASAQKIADAEDGQQKAQALAAFINELKGVSMLSHLSNQELVDAIMMATDGTDSNSIRRETAWSEMAKRVGYREADEFMNKFGNTISAATPPADQGTSNKIDAINESAATSAAAAVVLNQPVNNISVNNGGNKSTSTNTTNMVTAPGSGSSTVNSGVSAY